MQAIHWATALVLFCAATAAQAADEIQAFPPAEAGMVRYVLRLPPAEDESALKVELIVGKTVETDEINRHFFAGKIEEETIKGWGFPRYIVTKLGPMAGTLMAINPDAPKVAQFISLGGEPFLIRYNSRLPIVLYLPAGAEARFRIWHADQTTNDMEKGLKNRASFFASTRFRSTVLTFFDRATQRGNRNPHCREADF